MHQFIAAHLTDDISTLALQLHGTQLAEGWDADYILRQIDGWQRLRHKVPLWASTEGLLYPPRLALEQCSSQATAEYKARLLADRSGAFADLTGGFGVDFSFMAQGFSRATYVERNPELCRLARHNLPLLHLPEAEIVEGDGVEWLKSAPNHLTIFLDPFRRDTHGQKTYGIADCTPNLLEILPLLCAHADRAIAKLSPMLDLTATLRALPVSALHIVGTGGEMKEILLDMDFRQPRPESPLIVCHDEQAHLEYRLCEEQDAPAAACPASIADYDYLFVPSAVIMKAGCFRLIARRFGIHPLHPNSHLFVGSAPLPDFPGRTFRIVRTTGMGKRELRSFLAEAPTTADGHHICANLATRNFPLSVAELRKRLRLHDGGPEYWFATTVHPNEKCILACTKP